MQRRRVGSCGANLGVQGLTGLLSCIVLIVLSPNMLQVISLANPAIISFPLGCLACYLGTILGSKGAERERREGKQISYDEIYVRSLTGISNVEQEIREATPTQEPHAT